jgi:SAM-dependent methyltransferase
VDDAKGWVAGVFDRAAPSYDQAAGRYHEYFGERLVDLAGVRGGDAVLDVACGRGAALLPAASRAGAAGTVVGIDLSPEMVRLAREALDAAGVVADVQVMDAEKLQFLASTFRVVVCAFGVFFLTDPERAVADFCRVLVPGGVLGVSTWDREDPRWAWEDDLFADVDVPGELWCGRSAALRWSKSSWSGPGSRASPYVPRTTRFTSPMRPSGGRGSGPTACGAFSNSCRRSGWSDCAARWAHASTPCRRPGHIRCVSPR